jgi:hypothetical protein
MMSSEIEGVKERIDRLERGYQEMCQERGWLKE